MKVTKKNQKSKFRISWLKNPILKDWISNAVDRPNKAYCKFCKTFLYAHRYSIIKHASTRKHQQNSVQNLNDNIGQCKTDDDICRQQKWLTHNKNKDYINKLPYEMNVIEDDIMATYENKNEKKDSLLIDNCYPIQYEEEAYLSSSISSSSLLSSNKQTLEMLETDEVRNTGMITISTHVLDTTKGKPAKNIPIILYYLENDKWTEIKRSITNLDGRCPILMDKNEFLNGYYKLYFDVNSYLKETSIKFLYPFIEITFECELGQHYHIPLLLNPFGYSTYRGS